MKYQHLIDTFVLVFMLDHTMGIEPPFECWVPGLLVEETDQYLKIRTWGCVGHDEDDTNNEHVFVVKSAVTGINHLSLTGKIKLSLDG